MVIYSKLIQRKVEAPTATAAIVANENQFEDPIVARETIFYDHAGRVIEDLVYYDTNTHRGKKRLPNGDLKECFIKKVRVTIGQFGINRRRVEDEVHLEAIKAVVRSRVAGPARAEMVREIEERIREKRRPPGRPIQ